MPSKKIEKKTRTQKKQCPEISEGTIKILRALNDNEAFHFYEAIGKPTGETARNLNEFLDKVKTTKLESLRFHLQRKDFQNWINKILGDAKLANRIERIPLSQGEKLRAKIQEVVEGRIKELGDASVTLLVGEDLAVVSTSSMP